MRKRVNYVDTQPTEETLLADVVLEKDKIRLELLESSDEGGGDSKKHKRDVKSTQKTMKKDKGPDSTSYQNRDRFPEKGRETTSTKESRIPV